jgi:hypothetical protein
MTIFIVGLVMFVVGVVLNAIGWNMHRKSVKAVPGGYLDWFLEVLREWFGLLTGPESTTGQRIAAFGAILAALGIVVTIAGLLVWAV